MAVPQLSTGLLVQALCSDSYGQPITLQVLEVQHIKPKEGSANQPSRTKVTVSDGVHKCTALLASQLRELVDQQALQRGSIINVTEMVGNKKLSNTSSKKLMIFLGLQVVGLYPDTIGNPQPAPEEPAPGAPGGAGAAAANGGGGGMYGSMMGGAPPGQQPVGGGYGTAPPQAGGGFYGGPPAPAAAAAANGGGMYGGGGPAAQQQQQFGGFGGGAGAAGGAPAAGGPAYGMAGGGGGGLGGGAGGHGGPVAHSSEPLHIVPIKALNPYQARWTIKARVTQKGDVRRWSNARSEGKLLSFDLVDKDGGEIRATAWNDQVDAYNDIVQVGRVVTISRASLKPRNPKFNSTPHEYEIYLERSSVVTPVEEDADAAAIPHMMYNFRKLAELEACEAGTIVDVIGVVDSVDGWVMITRRDNTDTRKRSVVVRDDSGRSVEVTLWDKFATAGDGGAPAPGDALEQALAQGVRPVVAFKSLRVGDFNGKTLGSLGSSSIAINPDRPEAGHLRAWYDGGGAALAPAPLSERGGGGGGRQDRRVCMAQIRDEGLGQTAGQADWVQAVAVVSNIKSENSTYPACPRDFNGRPCHKKLHDTGGGWHCDRCNAPVDNPSYRYLLSLRAQDHTGVEWINAFGESGEVIMGRPASDIHQLDVVDGGASSTSLFASRFFFPYTFKFKVHTDTYNDEARLKVTVSKVAPLDFVSEGRHLLEMIHKLEAGQVIYGPSAAAGGAAAGGYPGAGQTPPKYNQHPQQAYGGGGMMQQQQPQQQQQQQQQQWGAGPGNAGGWGGPAGGGGGGWGGGAPAAAAAAAGGGGGGYGGGGYMQQQQQQQQAGGGYGGAPGGAPAMGGGGYGAPAAGGGGYGGGGGGGGGGWNAGGGGGYVQQQRQQHPGGFGQPPPAQQQQYAANPFNTGFA